MILISTKNSRGLKILDTTKIEEIDFEEEKKKLIERHIYVYNYEKNFIVNPIHGLVNKETFKKYFLLIRNIILTNLVFYSLNF